MAFDMKRGRVYVHLGSMLGLWVFTLILQSFTLMLQLLSLMIHSELYL